MHSGMASLNFVEIFKSMIIRIVGMGTKTSKEYFAAYHSTRNLKAVALSKALLLYCTAVSKMVFLEF